MPAPLAIAVAAIVLFFFLLDFPYGREWEGYWWR